jgi:nitrite reductase/ring-hydroxylating ferredoxin subunit
MKEGDHEPAWIPIALAEDIATSSASPVLVNADEFVLWRGAGGELRVWEDRCPHRGMRLSLGFVRGEELVCLYHGWRWGADAACAAIPAHPNLEPPKSLCVRSFGVREADGIVWMAMGDAFGEPPSAPPGAVPVASLLIERPLSAISARCRQRGTMMTAHAASLVLTLALQPLDEARTLAHIVASCGSELGSVPSPEMKTENVARDDVSLRRAALAAAEDLRMTIEAGDLR